MKTVETLLGLLLLVPAAGLVFLMVVCAIYAVVAVWTEARR